MAIKLYAVQKEDKAARQVAREAIRKRQESRLFRFRLIQFVISMTERCRHQVSLLMRF